MVWLQRKLRQTLGSVKDQTKIGLAKVSLKNNRIRDIEIGIVKATSHNPEVHPEEDDKSATQFLQILFNAPDALNMAAEALSKRFNRTRQWVVALKCVRLLHRLVRVGDGRFEEEIRHARASGLLVFSFFDFKDDAFFEFVRAYCVFVDEALDFGAPENEILNGVEEEEKVLVSLMDRTPKFQRLLDCAIACLPAEPAQGNRLVVVALEPVVRESFRLYAQIRACIATLVNKFFDSERSLCISAFEIYKKAAFQSHQLAAFYESCMKLGACRISEYPTVERISDEELDSWEELLSTEALCIEPEREFCGYNDSLCSPSPVYSLPLNEAQRNDCNKELILFDAPILGLETKITNDWEKFDSPKVRQEETVNSGSWELALDISAASASSSCSSGDPFAASVGIAPPSYVEMEDIKRKYAAMLEEQRFRQTYHNSGKNGRFQLQYYNPFCVPGIQNVPFGMLGTHGMLQVYNSGGIA
ncbi:hypothetical protein SUGI_0188000 [Cryptomeria japonica]|uniref:probable clathrin assembly protein At4g32285 n=1 Tax=Cryptomeria japonica TaxID=3369 RepID=UPI002408D764|nr:probable clathrin assembly protein At4g32285 [Cryptomeria japonica]GLJ12281.1 hypothetical protein SUGI_0188000 [Cryptomeria japonica]